MTALDVRAIPYETVHVSAFSRSSREKQLPTGGYLVPEVEIPVEGAGFRAVKDSSNILREIDAWPGSEGRMFPGPDVEEVEKRASSIVDAYVCYFNHVSRRGWERSIRTVVADNVPLGGLVVRVLPLHFLYRSVREGFERRVLERLGEDTELTDEAMTAGLVAELERYDAVVGQGVGGSGAFLHGYDYATAADVTLHAMVSRFTDGMGKGQLPASLPRLWDVAEGKLDRLKTWQAMMTERYPMVWDRSGQK